MCKLSLPIIDIQVILCHTFFFRKYYVVEFPQEIENGQVPMAIVPYVWIVCNGQKCYWPQNFKNNKEFTNAVINQDEKCISEDSQLCKINVKYKTSKSKGLL